MQFVINGDFFFHSGLDFDKNMFYKIITIRGKLKPFRQRLNCHQMYWLQEHMGLDGALKLLYSCIFFLDVFLIWRHKSTTLLLDPIPKHLMKDWQFCSWADQLFLIKRSYARVLQSDSHLKIITGSWCISKLKVFIQKILEKVVITWVQDHLQRNRF